MWYNKIEQKKNYNEKKKRRKEIMIAIFWQVFKYVFSVNL